MPFWYITHHTYLLKQILLPSSRPHSVVTCRTVNKSFLHIYKSLDNSSVISIIKIMCTSNWRFHFGCLLYNINLQINISYWNISFDMAVQSTHFCHTCLMQWFYYMVFIINALWWFFYVRLFFNHGLAPDWQQAIIDGVEQDCGNSIANTLKLPQSCTKL